MTAPCWDARLYNDKHSFVWQKGRGLVELLAPKAGETILDLGCGTGHLTAQIAASAAFVTGIDRSAEMIAEAKANYPGIEFRAGDATQLDFDEKFDAVFSNAVLHWVLEPEKVVRGVAKALKPGGRFVAEFGGKGNIRLLIEAVTRAAEAFGMPRGAEDAAWYYPRLGEYAALVEAQGLEVREALLFDRPTRLEDGEKGLEAWMRMFASFLLSRLPAERQAEFLREVERQARPQLFQNEGWELDYRRLRIAAWK